MLTVDRATQEPARRHSKTLAIAILVVAVALLVVMVVLPTLSFPLFAFHNSDALGFGASINATNISQNHTLRVNVWDRNNLYFTNQLPLPSFQSLPNLSMGPCSYWEYYPYGIALYQGRHTLDNISSATPVVIYDVYSAWFCGESSNANSFTFKPLQNVSSHVDLSGYWTAGETTYPGGGISEGVHHPFLPGVYTLEAGDAWGHIKILYFQVKNT